MSRPALQSQKHTNQDCTILIRILRRFVENDSHTEAEKVQVRQHLQAVIMIYTSKMRGVGGTITGNGPRKAAGE